MGYLALGAIISATEVLIKKLHNFLDYGTLCHRSGEKIYNI
jgi:hypothetical protein